MNPPRRIVLACLLLAVGWDARAAGAEDGFVALFNGTDLTGWRIAGTNVPSFRVRDGLLECTGRGHYPTWLRTDRTYENFVLRFEFKLPYYTEAGLLIHAPEHGRCSKVGIKINICDDVARGAASQPCGSIVGVAPPRVIATKRYNQWNQVEVVMDWPRLRVSINRELVQDVDCDASEALRYRLRQGYIGLQDLGCVTAYRNIRIRELPSREQWTPLFNGRDLSGWVNVGHAKWEVIDGVIRATDGTGYLISDAVFEDLELFAYVRTSRYANGGIFYRWQTLIPQDRGYEIQIYNMPDGNSPTGSIYAVKRADHMPVTDGEWFPMQIIVSGPRTIVRVNGETVARSDDLDKIRPGPIALQMHTRHGTIEFKDIRVKVPAD